LLANWSIPSKLRSVVVRVELANRRQETGTIRPPNSSSTARSPRLVGNNAVSGQEPLPVQIADVQPGKSFVIVMTLDQAVLSFEWLFVAVSDHERGLRNSLFFPATMPQPTPTKSELVSALILVTAWPDSKGK